MEYVVLARKLRPQKFQELVGQQTVAKALRNAVQGGRVAHAFLFAGSRGVGKTSAARILTKALNCLAPAEGEPCNACENCREITANASPDVHEIDGASNRGIDSIRELRENTRYAPAKCRFKTYIIDEVHMLTNESFNALLKTLEEPPPHIKFVLATTAPHRLPETILSRCQRYDFARIPVKVMVDHLAGVAAGESLTLSPEALEAIARSSAGGMRDALTALDQVVSLAGAAPTDEQVLSMLGLMDNREALGLLAAVLEKNLPVALETFAGLVDRGAELSTLLAVLLREIKELTLFQALHGAGGYFQDHAPSSLEFLKTHQGRCGNEELQQVFHLLLELEGQMKRSEFARACFEMALVKACRVAPLVGIPELLAQARALSGAPPAGRPPGAAPAPERRPPAASQPRARERGSAPAGPGAAARPAAKPAGSEDGDPEGAGGTATQIAANPAAAPASEPHPQPDARPTLPELPPAESSPREIRPAVPPEASPLPTAPSPGAAPLPAAPSPGAAPLPAAPSPGAAPLPPVAEQNPGSVPLPAGPPDASREPGAPPRPPLQEQTAASPPDASPAGGDAPAPPLETLLPCEDARWAVFIETVKATKPKLAADLRRAEVTAITENEVELVPPAGAELFSGPDTEPLTEALREAFGSAFHPRLNRDKNRSAHPAYSLVGRERQREEARLNAEKEAAAADPAVREVLRFFPQGSVRHIQPPNPDGSKDG